MSDDQINRKTLEWWKFLIGILIALVGSGAAAQAYLDKVDKRVSLVEERARALEDDMHWLRDQVGRIADRVGAERVPTPRR